MVFKKDIDNASVTDNFLQGSPADNEVEKTTIETESISSIQRMIDKIKESLNQKPR